MKIFSFPTKKVLDLNHSGEFAFLNTHVPPPDGIYQDCCESEACSEDSPKKRSKCCYLGWSMAITAFFLVLAILTYIGSLQTLDLVSIEDVSVELHSPRRSAIWRQQGINDDGSSFVNISFMPNLYIVSRRSNVSLMLFRMKSKTRVANMSVGYTEKLLHREFGQAMTPLSSVVSVQLSGQTADICMRRPKYLDLFTTIRLEIGKEGCETRWLSVHLSEHVCCSAPSMCRRQERLYRLLRRGGFKNPRINGSS